MPFCVADASGDVDGMRAPLAQGADPAFDAEENKTALHAATAAMQHAILVFLIRESETLANIEQFLIGRGCPRERRADALIENGQDTASRNFGRIVVK